MSHLNYALPVWGTSLTQQNFSRLQRIQSHAVCLLYHLNKYDHITSYYSQLRWLKFEQLVKFCTTSIMFYCFHSIRGIQLDPPIQFGNQSCHFIRTKPYFANPTRCHLSFTQKFFRHQATNWWNAMPDVLKEQASFTDFYKDSKLHFVNFN